MLIDTIGEILFFITFFTPVITLPLVWYTNKGDTRKWRLVYGLLWALLLSILFFITSMGILLRNGMGPV
jgi:hypothetical protein